MKQTTRIKPDQPAELVHLDNGIHKIIMPPTKQAVDDQFHLVLKLVNEHEKYETEKLLIIFELGDIGKIPTGYFVSRARKFWGENSMDHVTIRVAYMVKRNIFVDLFLSFMKTLRFKSERNLFNMTQEAEAIEWLLADRMIVKNEEVTA